MTHRGPIAKFFAILLAVAVPLTFVPTVSAQETASLTGTIYAAGSERPLDGAILHAGDLVTGDIYSSDRTGDDGEFALAGLPPAAYELAIESGGGLYIVGAPVEIEPGGKHDVQLALYPDAAVDPETAVRTKRSPWDRPLVATLFVIGGAFALGALVSGLDDEKEPIGSGSNPN